MCSSDLLCLPLVRKGGIIGADNILLPERFNEMMADYLSHVRRNPNVQPSCAILLQTNLVDLSIAIIYPLPGKKSGSTPAEVFQASPVVFPEVELLVLILPDSASVDTRLSQVYQY